MSSPYDTPGLTPPPQAVLQLGQPSPLLTTVWAVSAVSTTIMFIAVSMKLYTKEVILKELHWDDYTLVVAFVRSALSQSYFINVTDSARSASWYGRSYSPSAATGASRSISGTSGLQTWLIFLVCVHRILGKSCPSTLGTQLIVRIAKILNILETEYALMMGSAKMSILLQIRRIFLADQKSHSVHWATNILGFIIVGYYTSCFFVFVFQCVPRAGIWDSNIGARCINPKAATFSAGIINFITDALLLILPVWAIWLLQMPIRRKLIVASVFLTGIFGCTIGLIGTIYRIPLVRNQDFTYNIGIVGLWNMGEVCAVITVASMPCMPLFYKTLRGRLRSRRYQTSSDQAAQAPDRSAFPYNNAVGKYAALWHTRAHGGKLDSNAKYLGKDNLDLSLIQDQEGKRPKDKPRDTNRPVSVELELGSSEEDNTQMAASISAGSLYVT